MAVTSCRTEVLLIPGFACALCGSQDGPAMHLAVLTPEGRACLPRICQPCVSVFAGVLLQLLGHAGARVGAIAVSLNATGAPV